MQDFNNKVAFVTGAASGIGLAICKALLNAGSNVMMADINSDGLQAAAKGLGFDDSRIATVVCDVKNSESVNAAAKATIDAFGKVHIVVNNAGVGLGGFPGSIPLEDWRWITDINFLGVVYGVEAFVPLIQTHGEGGYIVNTASMAGHIAAPGMAPYHATKFAVVGYSEALAQELEKLNIGVSVLCPTWVKSNIHNTAAKRPSADPKKPMPNSKVYEAMKNLVESGISPDVLADLVLKSMQAKRLYIFNDPEAKAMVAMRSKAIMQDYDACLDDLGLS